MTHLLRNGSTSVRRRGHHCRMRMTERKEAGRLSCGRCSVLGEEGCARVDEKRSFIDTGQEGFVTG